MSAVSAADLRKRWIANAESLHRKGHFANYPPKQLAEVLKKGYLGRWPPDDAIGIAMHQAEQGYSHRMPQFNDNMRDHGLVGEEVREKLLNILKEIPPESYKPPKELSDPPGYPFHFQCRTLRCEVYFKFQILGTTKKPQVLFWSCHPPVYRKKRDEP